MSTPDVFDIAGFRGRREWFGYRFTQNFRDPNEGRTYWVSLLWFLATNDGRMAGPYPEGEDGKRAINVPLPVVFYAAGQVRDLMVALEALAESDEPLDSPEAAADAENQVPGELPPVAEEEPDLDPETLA